MTRSKRANAATSAILIKTVNITCIQNCRLSDGVRTKRIYLSFSFNRSKRMRQKDNYSLNAAKIFENAVLKPGHCAKSMP